MIKKELVLANIFDENWKEKIKNHKLTEIFMEDDITTSECRECPFRYICGGPCKAVSYNTTKSLLNGRGDYCKRAKKEAVEYIKSIDFGD